ncbi:nuclear transport factor 2 family protein [Pseudonocardia acidicola]|uniref:Nuclear transport factor 2 family protein n=1 Tax=Pseudonocardia acidicola TaxID=2724939 RepID=A0ABX1SHR9_9PSEU|nr:nuclear transport factor 2 family protein [Pseudonocardia acidicola]NMI01125.1 nuclear transport factor 2 family protein [Pseudonocardia acidicola]
MTMSPEEIERNVRELRDRQEILDCLMRYSRGVDRLDRDLLLSVYHEDAIDDHGMFVGDREEFADWVVGMHGSTHLSHQHCLFNHTCELDGDVAHTETYYMFCGMNREGTPLAMSGGRYVDRFERRDGRWAIAARVCVRDWAPLDTQPDPEDPSTMTAIRHALPPAVLEFMRTGPLPTRDRRDPSYDRPLRIDPDRVAGGHALRG